MKRLFSLIVGCSFLLSPCFLWAQSYLGDVHTPKGDLHLLVIFVRYTDANLMPNSKVWPNDDRLPNMARGSVNDLFHQNPDDLGQITDRKNISDFYYTMSGGKFRLTADIYPVQVPVKHIRQTNRNFFSRQGKLNQAAINWITENDPDFDWGKYDRRTNRPRYKSDNSQSIPDSILDYVVIMHRAPGSTGMGASSNLGIPGSRYRITNGHTGILSYADPEHNWEYFKHEFAHNLYSAPHYLGANSTDGDKFYTQKGWGLMAAWHAPFFTTNAWENWWLGWMEPQTVTETGRYQLKDLVTSQDAIRISLPGTEDVLWIENHQKQDKWDDKIFYKDASQGQPQSAAGLYCYVVAAPGFDRAKPQLNPFNRKSANLIKMYNGEGNFDFLFLKDTVNRAPVFMRGLNNPIAGQNAFQFMRADFDQDGKILVGMSHGNSDRGGREQYDLWVSPVGDQIKTTYACTGDENDALGVGAELGLSGRFPLLNYPIYDKRKQQLAPFVLNGISINIFDQAPDGTFTLDIRFDDWYVRESQRWCGNILWKQLDSLAQQPLTIVSGNRLTLDLSGTPDRESVHPETKTFVNPTRLHLEPRKSIIVEEGAELKITRWSELSIAAYGKIVVRKGGQLSIEKQGLLALKGNSQLILEKGAKLMVGPEGKLAWDFPEQIQFDKRSKVRDKRHRRWSPASLRKWRGKKSTSKKGA
ncbi:MAG: hypothetical protein AAFR61_10205 [Bacteroidota bacterium]